MTKIFIQYNKTQFDHYTNTLKNAFSNESNTTAFELVGTCI
jgi:hypothetical protein